MSSIFSQIRLPATKRLAVLERLCLTLLSVAIDPILAGNKDIIRSGMSYNSAQMRPLTADFAASVYLKNNNGLQ